MIVRDLDLEGIAIMPGEAKTPLVVHSNTMLSQTVANQRFQPVARRRPQIVQTGR
jgi:hypothetical protein